MHRKTIATSGKQLDLGQRNAGVEYVRGTGFMVGAYPFIKGCHVPCKQLKSCNMACCPVVVP